MTTNWKHLDVDEEEFYALQKAHGVDSRAVYRLSDASVKELRKLYAEYQDTRRFGEVTSAYGHHYLFARILRKEGVPMADADSMVINRYCEEAITYGQVTVR